MSAVTGQRLMAMIRAHRAVVAALDDDDDSSVVEIARRAGVPRSTANRHMHALLKLGHVERVSHQRWRRVDGPPVALIAATDLEPNGSAHCEACGSSLSFFGGRLICMSDACLGEAA